MADLELTLAWLGMDRYLERFIEAGFDSWETVLEITESDLNVLNVDLGHRRKLQREIANTKRLARDPANVTPKYRTGPPPPITTSGIPSSSTNVKEGGPPTKRGYRHHPKPDPNAPERPYSAYVLFSNHTREQLKDLNLSFIDLSRIVGENWQQLSRDEKEEWKKKGAEPWEIYKAELARYQKTDVYHEYQRYLADFKTAQIAKNPQGKSDTMMQQPVYSLDGPTNFSSKHRQMGVGPTQQPEDKQKQSLVAIKRLKRDEDNWNQGSGLLNRSQRARQACESCRNKKIKCYGELPTCRHCRELGVECYYASGRRDQRKRQDDEVWRKLKAYEELLLKLVPQVDDDDQQAVQDAILMPPYNEAAKRAYKETVHSRSQTGSLGGGVVSDDSGAGSMGPTDEVNNDDFLQPLSARHGPSFVGQSSEAKWTERLNEELLPKPKAKTQNRTRGLSQKSNPYTEDMDTAVVGHQIDPFSLPVKSTADSLINAYFSTVHTSFPILNKMDFMNQYDRLYSTMDPEAFEQRVFIATLQLVFAIAAVHAHLVQAHWAGDARDHMLYLSQARVLAIDTGIFNDDCHLSQVQVFGLGGMYLLVTNQLNRAWNISGLAVRSAQALGLHLRDVSGSVSAETKKSHACNWFALMTLESMLTLMTGRPTMINPRDCSVTIPRSLAEGTSTTTLPSESSYKRSSFEGKHRSSSSTMSEPEKGLSLNSMMKHDTTRTAAIYFVHYAELCILVMQVVGELYQPGIRNKKRPEIQRTMDGFDTRLFDWKDGVNPPFDVASPSTDPETESCRVALRILFYSTRTIIHRPCLCRIKERIQDRSSSSKGESISSASKCVESARATLNLILHKPESINFYEGTMWWMLLHHHKRALTVLLLELAFRAQHVPSDAGEILAEAKAAISWLDRIGKSSPDTRRTCSHMRKLLRIAAQKVGGDTADMVTPPEDEAAPTYFGQPQPPLDNADPNAFASSGPFGGPYFREQWQYYGDMSARNELDQFGFLRAEGGVGSLFPTASEMDRMSTGREEEDYDVDGDFRIR